MAIFSKGEIRHAAAGFLIGSVHLFLLSIAAPYLTRFVGMSDQLFPTFGTTFLNYLVFVFSTGLLSGCIGLLFYRYKNALRSFLTGFVLGVLLHGLLSGPFLFYPPATNGPSLNVSLVGFYLPILFGVFVSIFLLPKE